MPLRAAKARLKKEEQKGHLARNISFRCQMDHFSLDLPCSSPSSSSKTLVARVNHLTLMPKGKRSAIRAEEEMEQRSELS